MPLDNLTGGPLKDPPFMRITDAEGDQERSWPYWEEEEVVERDGESDDKRLDRFDAVDPGEDVEGVGGEGGK